MNALEKTFRKSLKFHADNENVIVFLKDKKYCFFVVISLFYEANWVTYYLCAMCCLNLYLL